MTAPGAPTTPSARRAWTTHLSSLQVAGRARAARPAPAATLMQSLKSGGGREGAPPHRSCCFSGTRSLRQQPMQPAVCARTGNTYSPAPHWLHLSGVEVLTGPAACSFGQQVDEELLRERRNARRKARSVAWEEEKREASANKVPAALPVTGWSWMTACAGLTRLAARLAGCEHRQRSQYDSVAGAQARNDRLRWRTANARAERHARVLSRHWQTHVGLCWQDWLVMSAFVASTLCAGALLRGPTRPPDAAAGPGAGL